MELLTNEELALRAAILGLPKGLAPRQQQPVSSRKSFGQFQNAITPSLEFKHGLDCNRLLNGSTNAWFQNGGLMHMDAYNSAIREFNRLVNAASKNVERFEKYWNSHMFPAFQIPRTAGDDSASAKLCWQQQPSDAMVPYNIQPVCSGDAEHIVPEEELTLVWRGTTLHYYNASYKPRYVPAELMVQVPKDIIDDVSTKFLYMSDAPRGYNSDGYHRCCTSIYVMADVRDDTPV